MSPLAIGALVGTLITFGIYLVVAYRDARRMRGADDYFFYNHSLSRRQSSATIFASGMSFATVLIALLDLGITFGISLIWASVAAYCGGWLAILPFVSRIRKKTYGHLTLHGFLGDAYRSNLLRQVASIATAIGFLGTFAAEIIAGTLLFDALGFETSGGLISIGIFAAVAIIYSSLGGFKSVIRSDNIQSNILIPGVIIIFVLAILLRKESGLEGTFDPALMSNWQMPFWVAVGFILINVVFPFVDMSAWQRIVAAESSTSWRRGTYQAVIGFAILWTLLIFAAMALGGGVLGESQLPFIAMMQFAEETLGYWSVALGFILFPALIAAMLSTADTFLNAAGHTLTFDFGKTRTSSEQLPTSLGRARVQLVFVGALGFGLCLILRIVDFQLVPLIFAVYGTALALFPAVIVALLASQNVANLKLFATLSVVTGFIAGWGNGFLSVVCINSASEVCMVAGKVIALDPYQSPLFAFLTASVVYFSGFIIQILLPKEAD